MEDTRRDLIVREATEADAAAIIRIFREACGRERRADLAAVAAS